MKSFSFFSKVRRNLNLSGDLKKSVSVFAILGGESRDVPELFQLQRNEKINNLLEFGDHNPVVGMRSLNGHTTLVWFDCSSYIVHKSSDFNKISLWKISKEDGEFLKTVLVDVKKRNDILWVGKKSIKMEDTHTSLREFNKEFVLFVHFL